MFLRFVPLHLLDNSHKLYNDWIRQHDILSEDDKNSIRQRISSLKHKPMVSIVVPVYNTPLQYLRLMIQSVLAQLYPYWELCIADDASTNKEIRALLEEYSQKDKRIKCVYRDINGHISAASNSALSLATGEFLALLDHDDLLPEHALYMVAEEINRHPDAAIVYSDEDKITTDGIRFDPYFKPDWDPDLFYSMNMISHLGVYRRSLVKKTGGFREGLEGSQDYDLALRCIERIKPRQIRHIPHILYHWRALPGSVAAGVNYKTYAHVSARKAIREHFERTGVNAMVTESKDFHYHRVIYPLPKRSPGVSIIIPSFGCDDPRTCIEQIFRYTEYTNFEVILLSGSRIELPFNNLKVITCDDTANRSLLLNRTVKKPGMELLCFMHPSMEACSPGWLREMVSHALRPGIGCVGSKEYYPDGSIRQAGMVLGLEGKITAPLHERLQHDSNGYHSNAVVSRGYTVVSANCMVMKQRVFNQAGGFDEANLPGAYSDIDLCLRVREKGYRNMWTPHAEFIYHGNRTVGQEVSNDSNSEKKIIEYFRKRWGDLLAHDPSFNPNIIPSQSPYHDIAFSKPGIIPYFRY